MLHIRGIAIYFLVLKVCLSELNDIPSVAPEPSALCSCEQITSFFLSVCTFSVDGDLQIMCSTFLGTKTAFLLVFVTSLKQADIFVTR